MSDLGEITPCYTMSFERRSKHPATKLWRSITDAAEVSKWMGYPAKIDLRVGGDWHVDFSHTDGGELDGVIVRIETERRLAYVWGLSLIEWRLEPTDDGCQYTFVHHGQPLGLVPEEEGIAAGWHAWLEALDDHLDGAARSDAADQARCQELQPRYREAIDAALGRS